MSTASILALALAALLIWFGNRVQKPELVQIENLSKKKVNKKYEMNYRKLHGLFYMLYGVLIGVYGLLLVFNLEWFGTKLKIVYFLIIVSLNEVLRRMSKKYYVS